MPTCRRPRNRRTADTMLKIIFLALMALGLPVAISMAGSSLIYLLWQQTTPPFVVIHRMVSGIDSFPLLAVPFFILAGNLMNNAGITNRIYNFALALVGWLRGGLGHVNIIGSVIFAGMSGTAIADAAGLGTIEIKAMRDHGYSSEFSVGVTAASATLGPIIPPSLPFVIYGMMANVSVGALFLAGIVPGVLMAVLMMLTVAYYAHKNGWGADVKFEWHRVTKALAETAIVIVWPLSLWLLVTYAGFPPQLTVLVGLVVLFAADKRFQFQAVLPIMTPVLLIGGMSTGIFTPTEGAIAACIWAMVLGFAWYRTLTWKMFVKVCLETIETTATVLFIVAAASIFGWMLTATGITAAIADWVLGFTRQPWVFLLLANALMLFVGCFLEPTAAIMILVPILVPICQKLGIDLVHFGLVMVLNLMIGLLHPPTGMVLFVLARVAKLSVERTTVAILPWLVPLLLSLAIITYIPVVVLWLPKMFY
jgi:TRAP-type C4-dicarboxylate transport system permease large subunit